MKKERDNIRKVVINVLKADGLTPSKWVSNMLRGGATFASMHRYIQERYNIHCCYNRMYSILKSFAIKAQTVKYLRGWRLQMILKIREMKTTPRGLFEYYRWNRYSIEDIALDLCISDYQAAQLMRSLAQTFDRFGQPRNFGSRYVRWTNLVRWMYGEKVNLQFAFHQLELAGFPDIQIAVMFGVGVPTYRRIKTIVGAKAKVNRRYKYVEYQSQFFQRKMMLGASKRCVVQQ
jgi:hypothetical protein